jgi:geranylgeranyl diphosphate synthase, type I
MEGRNTLARGTLSLMVSAPPLTERFTDELLACIEAERATLEPEAQPLLDELEAVIAAGGKRLRPAFCFWGHIAAGGSDSPAIVRVGAALELLHTFAMIHDDVMDSSALRRNRVTTFRALAELSAGVPHRGDPKRFGMSAAILAGLLGFVLADRLFHSADFDPAALERAADRYDRMRTGAIAGQYLDLLAAYRGDADEATARRIGVLKSGGYSVADPLVIGALLASDDEGIVRALEGYGRPLGEAFQIRDDVLGVFGDPDVTGKDRDGDLREGKQTVLLAKARDLANAHERRLLDTHVGDSDLAQDDAARVRDVIVSTGALDATNVLIAELTDRARTALRFDGLTPAAVGALSDLADAAAMRDA